MIVKIDQAMRDMAAWAEQQCDAYHAKYQRNYTKLNAAFRWYYGFLGELVFVKYCQAHWLQYRYEPVFGQGDKSDVVLWADGYGQTGVDVKTASKGSHRYLMLPTSQLEAHPSEVYVGVRINNQDEAEVLGFALKGDLKPITDLELEVPTSGILFTGLRPMSKMLAQAKKVMG